MHQIYVTYGPQSSVFVPSPYSVNWERLQQASICTRKLCLIYLGVESDRNRKKSRSTVSPTIPMGQPSASALGAIGELSVVQSLVEGIVDITDDFKPIHPHSRILSDTEVEVISTPSTTIQPKQISRQDIKPLSKYIPEPEILELYTEKWTKVCRTVADIVDYSHEAFLINPYEGLTVVSRQKLDQLRPNLKGYEFRDIYRQVPVSSSAILLSGIFDFITTTPDGELLPIEVKNSAGFSGKDRFQLIAYLNALNTGGNISERVSINPEYQELQFKHKRLENILRSLRYKAEDELSEYTYTCIPRNWVRRTDRRSTETK